MGEWFWDFSIVDSGKSGNFSRKKISNFLINFTLGISNILQPLWLYNQVLCNPKKEKQNHLNKKEIINEISEFAKKFDFQKINKNENGMSILMDYFSGISLFIRFRDEDEIEFYFYQRTTSHVYNGERTDLHDVISVTFAAFLKGFDKQVSCAFYDVPHPAVPELNSFEIYARYIVPRQFKYQFTENNKDSIEEFRKLITSMVAWKYLFWQVVGCPCRECFERFNPPYEYNIEINKDFKSKILSVLEEKENWNQMTRFLPTWEYYKNFDEGISVIKSKGLSELMYSLKKEDTNTFQYIEGVEGELVFDKNLQNVIKNSVKKKSKEILIGLGVQKIESAFFIPLENITLISCGEYLLFHEEISDKYEFKKEKERVRKRHEKESQALFPVDEFKWEEKINPDLFESLIRELLAREPNVSRIRKVAPLNQPDGGRDLIMEINEPINFNNKNGKSPYVTRKIIVQCKAYKKNIGKGDVRDIRDTIDSYNYDGYFLAVSSQITTPLTDYLDRLRNRGIWMDWWNRDEIEDRLTIHRDILSKYSEIVKIK